ncbi:hypothetical protein BS78_K121600 [Paspalum vaginatum]|uniref:CCHC-type domain-containing protein n=1 Tax=Paspalum vaginatum TaxID=158149 RepID=A0A9W7X8S3_9POAL|nr:hypothetical protein BS78_K121600 [Paspalum vaginatum]
MTHSGKILILGSDGYSYWNVAQRTTPAIVAQHEANAKAVNFLFSGLGPLDYEKVSHLETARQIWSLLSAHHEGIATIKGRLVETYRREYENFVQKPGDSIDDLFGHFQTIINKLRVNSSPERIPYTDHQQAVKLLYALDRKVWEIKVNSIIESEAYDTIGVETLYSKLKATELVSLGDDELCLVSSRFQRAYDNRMSKKRGERPKSFECGEVGHFIAECPNKQNDYYKKGKNHSRDSNKYHSGKRDHTKHRSGKIKNFWKAFKSYQKDNRKRDKAFFAALGGLCGGLSSSSSSSSSSSDEEIVTKRDKRRDQGGPARLCFVSTKSKRKHKMHRRSFCSMALEDKDDKGNDNDSSDEEVTREQAEILEMLESNSRELKAQDRLLEKAAKKLQKQKAKLADALAEIERLKSVSAQPSETECPTCETLMRDLCEQKSKYAHQVEEMDRLKVELGKLQSKLDEPILSDVTECEMCPHLAVDIAELKVKCEGQLKELEELRARPMLLGACMVCPTLESELVHLRADLEMLLASPDTCENCLTLRLMLVDRDATIKKLEKSAFSIPSLHCHTCADQTLVLKDLREEKQTLVDENNRLREVLSWMYAREPQLRMILESTKRAEGDTSGLGLGESSTSGEKRSSPIKLKTASPQPSPTVDGVYHEPLKAAPKKQFWTPKPSQAKLDRVLTEILKPPVSKERVQHLVPPKATTPKPKAQPKPTPKRLV